ncbi:ureidoglycolate lyase [Chiayiivirga flava]|uniref:Ureidoglycolate lyase n=1 Tax=Chiayiivirga flava TaxID=659595 RepID=A0A7W8G0I5_9GAMM|nr:ureidoglycolate lyase [Chiayiivirga flava]MBB5209211.1 ureidoglycolate lyase [Chiayiivirga flava]
MQVLRVEPLTRTAFAPFGDVIAADDEAHHYPINEGTTERYHDLARVDVQADGGRALISIFRAQPRVLPFEVRMLERHPLGSQAFVPLSAKPYLVVVAPAGALDPASVRAFSVADGRGVNLARGVWHHPLLALQACDFLVVDRGGAGNNLDECVLPVARVVEWAGG